MKKYILASLIAAALATSAEAACTKKSLNGSWAISLGGSGVVSTMTGGAWVYNIDANNSYALTITSLSKSKCKGNAIFALKSSGTTTTYPTRVAMEHIDPTSGLKPNIIHFTAAIAPPVNYVMYLQRQ